MSGSADTTVRIWDVADGKQVHIHTGRHKEVYSVVFLPDGNQVIFINEPDNKVVSIWDIATGKQIDKYYGEYTGHVALSRNGKLVLSEKEGYYIWDVVTGTKTYDPTGNLSPAFHPRFEHITLISPDGKQVVSELTRNKVCVWDVDTGKQIIFGCPPVDCAALSNEHLILNGPRDTLRIWDVATGKLTHKFSTHLSNIQLLLFSPDGKQFLSISEYTTSSRTVCIWSVATSKLICEFKAYYRNVNSVAFSPDGKQVVAGLNDKTLCIWDMATGKEIQQLGDQSAMLRSVTFSPDGMQVLCKVFKGTTHQWDVTIETQTPNMEPTKCRSSSPTSFSPSYQGQ